MKKKVVALILASVMAAGLVACGGSAEQAASAAEETADEQAEGPAEEPAAVEVSTVTAGKLTVATSPDFAPYEFYAIGADGTPKLAGFDMALAQYIADYMGLELDVIPMDFDGVLVELATGKVDLGMAGLSPDPARMDAMDFSDIYYLGGQSLVTTKSKADQITSLEDSNKAEVSVGAQTGSIQVELAKTNSPDANRIELPKVTDIITDLLGGNLDAAYIETAVAESYQKNYPDLVIVCNVPYEVSGSAIGVKKGNEELRAAVNEAIAAAIADGTMDDYVAEANELAAGEMYEGLLDDAGNIQ